MKMSTALQLFAATTILALAACAEAPPRTEERTAAASAEADAAPCASGGGPVLTGAAVGGVAIRDEAEDVRRRCAVVGDTTLMLEGQPQPAMRVALGGDTIIAEVVEGRIWRIRVTSPGLATSDSLRVGTPARRLAELPGAQVLAGEGQTFLISPAHCGLSFGLEGVPVRARPMTTAELASLPDRVRVGAILVTGC
jgi:hypothetical protein